MHFAELTGAQPLDLARRDRGQFGGEVRKVVRLEHQGFGKDFAEPASGHGDGHCSDPSIPWCSLRLVKTGNHAQRQLTRKAALFVSRHSQRGANALDSSLELNLKFEEVGKIGDKLVLYERRGE